MLDATVALGGDWTFSSWVEILHEKAPRMEAGLDHWFGFVEIVLFVKVPAAQGFRVEFAFTLPKLIVIFSG